MDISTKILSEITVYMKYAKFLPNKNRRETWTELVNRNRSMHIKKYPEVKDAIKQAQITKGNLKKSDTSGSRLDKNKQDLEKILLY